MSIDLEKELLNYNKEVYEMVKKTCKSGLTEKDIYAMTKEKIREKANYEPEFLCDIISGERCALIGGVSPTDRSLKDGDALIFDLSVHKDDFWSDTCRTFFINPSNKMKEAYDCILRAIRIGENIMKKGVYAHDVYMAVSCEIEKVQGKPLIHHAGHRLGVAPNMAPDMILDNKEIIEEGFIMTIEPGIYFEDFGIRVENVYEITNNKAINLFNYKEDMDYFILNIL